MCSQSEAEPGPPLNAKITGRASRPLALGEIGEGEDRGARVALGIGQPGLAGDAAIGDALAAEAAFVAGLEAAGRRRGRAGAAAAASAVSGMAAGIVGPAIRGNQRAVGQSKGQGAALDPLGP